MKMFQQIFDGIFRLLLIGKRTCESGIFIWKLSESTLNVDLFVKIVERLKLKLWKCVYDVFKGFFCRLLVIKLLHLIHATWKVFQIKVKIRTSFREFQTQRSWCLTLFLINWHFLEISRPVFPQNLMKIFT